MSLRIEDLPAHVRAQIGAPAKTRTTRRTGHHGTPYATRCVSCGTTFTSAAAEDRHVAPGHGRYELVLEQKAG